METTSYGSACEWDDLKPGMLFSFSDGEKSCFAIKLDPNTGESEPHISAALTPGFLDDNEPKILLGVNYFTGGIYQWDKEKVVIAPNPDELGFGSAKRAAVGDLLLAEDTTLLTIKGEGSVRAFFDVSTGKLLEKRPDRYVTFSGWRLLLEQPDGWKSILKWPKETTEKKYTAL